MKVDFIVVGGGTGGSIIAEALAGHGYQTYLFDRHVKEEIGNKVCGEAVGKHHFDTLGISPPTGDELDNRVVGINIFSPDLKTIFRVQGAGLHGFVIDRKMFGQRLLDDALNAGVELYDNTLVLKPILSKGFVIGVKVKTFTENKHMTFYAKAVIDASGMAAVLRKGLPSTWEIEREVNYDEVEICYREIREIDHSIDDHDFLRMYLNQEHSPGGYAWIFPKKERQVNVGIGIKMLRPFPNPKTQLYKHILTQPLFKNSKILNGGGGTVSTRRPINCMTGNGILFIGDSACQPNPIHGGGIGPSMLAARLAAKTLEKAYEEEDFSNENLWTYNMDYMRTYGTKSAGLDVFRIFLQKCTNDDLNHGMRNRLIKEDDLLNTSIGQELRLNVTEKAKRIFRGLRKLSFLRTLHETSKKMREVRRLYEAYPKFNKFPEWAQRVNNTFENYELYEM